MTECRQIESLLPPYVDGEATPEASARVQAHLATCAACRVGVEAERTARAVLHARRSVLTAIAPPGLRTRIGATLHAPQPSALGWRGRLTAFAAAAAIVLVVATALEFVSPRSNVLFAAQLAVDHWRCFVAEHASHEPVAAESARREYATNYGWVVDVPASSADAGVTLVAARRCPFWLGPHAHLLYRTSDGEVSLFVSRNTERIRDELSVLGHAQHLWTAKGNSYAVVARGLPEADLDRIVTYLQHETTKQR